MNIRLLALFLALCFGATALQAGKPASWQELRQQIRETKSFRLGAPAQIQFLPDGRTVLFLRAQPPSSALSLYALDKVSGEERLVLDSTRLDAGGGQISAEEKALRERLRIQTSGINFYAPDPKGERLLIPYRGKLYVWSLASSQLLEIAKGQGPIFQPRWSPDGQWVAYVRSSNLYVAPSDGGAERALTQGGTEQKSYGLAEFVAQEELSRQDGFWWAPDSRSLLVQEVDQSEVERLVISDPSQPEREPQRPYYPRPGKANARTRLGLVRLSGGSIDWIDFGPHRFEYLAAVQWDKQALTVQVFDRLQKSLKLLRIQPESKELKLLLEEQDSAWVNHEAQFPLWIDEGKSFLWLSERAGRASLERRAADGSFQQNLTDKSFGFQEWGGLDPTQSKALLQASDRSETSALWMLDLKQGTIKPFLEETKGLVTLLGTSKHGLFAVRRNTLAASEETLLGGWADAGNLKPLKSLAPEPLVKPVLEVFTLGPDEVRVSVVRPRSFQKGRRYPAIEQVYGGPGSQMVRLSGRAYLSDQVMADALDALVVRMDTRGTPGRGRDWERAIAGRFGILPVTEHAEIWKLLQKKLPELDPKRIGVTGWSYGGYFSAYAALLKPDVYQAAVVGAPPVDWLDYDTAYTERYLGLPSEQAEAYRQGSLLALIQERKAAKAKAAPMLIMHGTADDNVYFNQSLKLVDALERAAYPYEFVPLAGMTHMVTDSVLEERRFLRSLEFFREKLKVSLKK